MKDRGGGRERTGKEKGMRKKEGKSGGE